MFKKMRIKAKLFFAFILILLPATIILSVGAYVSHINSRHALLVKETNLPNALLFIDIEKDVIMIQDWLTNVALTRGAKGYDQGFDEAQKHYNSAINNVDKLIEKFQNTPDELKEIEQMKANLKNYYDVGNEVAHAYLEGGSEAGNAMLDVFVVVRDKLNNILSRYRDNQTQELINTIGNIQKDLDNTKITNIIFVFAFFLFGFIIVLFMANKIVRPIISVNTKLNDISNIDGDLTAKLLIESKDELGEMAKSFNTFVDKIRNVIKEVKDFSKNLATSSTGIAKVTDTFSMNIQSQAASSEEIHSTIEQISASMDLISNRAGDQFQQMNSLIEQMQGLSKIITNMSRRIGEAMSLVEDISSSAKSGSSYLDYMNESMNKISNSSSKITDIVNIINDISDKINLLSLNAAIEAARAGDAGRGFAVVADEISKLADQTAVSIKDIDQLVTTNDKEITKGMKNVTDTVNIISKIINGVKSINEMMNNISTDMTNQLERNDSVNNEAINVKNKSEEIRYATEELKIAVDEISKSISTITESTQITSTGAENIATNTKQASEMTENLNKLVDFFKT
ncbi:MAG: methyl-accepting chemotaxis protein [Spirochaetota bacterium]|nr:methyl-accepting chemotaxis protein [Spirochaetota bacterium]